MNFGSLFKSVLFHVVIIVLMTVGIAFTPARDIVMPPPMTVELATVAELTQTPTPVAKPPIQKPEDQKPAKTEEKPKPKPAPTNTSDVPVAPVEKPKEEKPPPPPEQEAEVKPAPKPEPIKEEKPPEPKPETNKKAAEKQPEPEEKPKEPEKEKAEPKPQRDFGSVLKNLAANEETPEPETPNVAEKVLSEMGQNAPLGAQLTISELDALRRQLEGCWNVPIGARNAADMVVDVNLVVGPDKIVKQSSIVDKARYNNDSFFRAMADSAIRAVHAPACSPLALPEGKYDMWKNIIFTFNPRNMY